MFDPNPVKSDSNLENHGISSSVAEANFVWESAFDRVCRQASSRPDLHAARPSNSYDQRAKSERTRDTVLCPIPSETSFLNWLGSVLRA